MDNKKRLIDANALKAHVNGISTHWLNDWSTLGVLAAVDRQPTVDAVEVVHGRWEEWWPGISVIMTGEEMLHRCSSCDAKYADVEGYEYCPHCGAKMDGDGNG